jgi:5-methylcytosine-specific restriction endonuclease McrA
MTDQDMTADSGAVNLPKTISRKAARAAELKRFFSGKPCPNGHIVERRVDNGSCVACCAQRSLAYYFSDHDKSRARNAAFRAANPDYGSAYRAANAEKERARSTAWKAANLAREVAYQANHYAVNREKVRARHAKWKKENLAKSAVHSRNRRARQCDVGGEHTATDIERLYDLQSGQCAVCTAEFSEDPHTVDHIIPIVRGGSNAPENLHLLCGHCNYSKGTKDYQVWLDQNRTKLDKKRAYWTEWRSMKSAADAAF